MTLFLVRHGRPWSDQQRPAACWLLAPSTAVDVRRLRASGRLPDQAMFCASPEPKALATACLLTDQPVRVVDDLREQVRDGPWVEDFDAAVRRAFARPDEPAHPGWEPLAECRRRVVTAVRGLLRDHPDGDLVLVGHGAAWTIVVAELSGEEPDLERWRRLRMPDVLTAFS